MLELLASQAAISLENARLYNDLQEREARDSPPGRLEHYRDHDFDVQGRIIEANQAFLDMLGYSREDLISGRLRWTELTPAEWRDADDTGQRRAEGGRNRPAPREGIPSQRRQPCAGSARCYDVRRQARRGRCLRA